MTLTVKQIEEWRAAFHIEFSASAETDALCDLALSALDAPKALMVKGAELALMHRYAHPLATPSENVHQRATEIIEMASFGEQAMKVLLDAIAATKELADERKVGMRELDQRRYDV